MNFFRFEIQRFGGKGGSTTIQTTEYTPTEYELQLQQIQVGYTKAISPNALMLNEKAKNMLAGSIGEAEEFNEAYYQHYNTSVHLLDKSFQGIDSAKQYVLDLLEELADKVNETGILDRKMNDILDLYLDVNEQMANDPENNLFVVATKTNALLERLKNDTESKNVEYLKGYAEANESIKRRLHSLILTYKDIAEKEGLHEIVLPKIGEALKNTEVKISKIETRLSDTADVINSRLETLGADFFKIYMANYCSLEKVAEKIEKASFEVETNLEKYSDAVETVRANNYRELDRIPAKLENAVEKVNAELAAYSKDIATARDTNDVKLNGLPSNLENILEDVNSNLEKYSEEMSNKRDINYEDFDELIPKFRNAADLINGGLRDLDGDVGTLSKDHRDNYDKIIPYYLPAAHKSNIVIRGVESGAVPTNWQNNMQDSLKLALENTIGRVVNENAKRGVLNSSVTTQAIYDIERNASDETARQYHQNLNTIANFAETRWKNIESALNDMKSSYDGLYGTYLNGLGLQLQIKQNEYGNINAALLGQLQTFDKQIGNYLQGNGQSAQFDEKRFSNADTDFKDELQLCNVKLNNYLQAVNQQVQLSEKCFSNEVESLMNKLQVWNAQLSNALQGVGQEAQIDETRFNDIISALQSIANLKNQSIANSLQNLKAQEQLQESQHNNRVSALMNQGNFYNSDLNNALNAYQKQASIADAIFANQLTALNAKSQIYQQIISNELNTYSNEAKVVSDNAAIIGDTAKNTLSNLISVQGVYQNLLNLVSQYNASRFNRNNEFFTNRMSAVPVYLNLYDRYFSHSAKYISNLAAVQEAAQQSALRLWNASIGLNQQATGALVALSNQGTRTTTTEQHQSGQFLGGLFGGMISGFAGGLASGYGGSLGNSLFK